MISHNQKRNGLIALSVSVLFIFLLTAPSTSAASIPSFSAISSVTITPSTLYTGYAVVGPFTSGIRVKGSWIVPTANCGVTPNSVSNISVIIDGINGEGDVMQVGTYQNCVSGVAQYGAFANFAPAVRMVGPTLTIKPGDIIEAQGKWDTQTNSWHAQIIDKTTGITQALHASTPKGYSGPKLDSGAFLLSSNGHTLTSLTTISLGVHYTAWKQTDIVGPPHAHNAIQMAASMTGFTLVAYQMTGTILSVLTSDGGSFQIS